MVELQIVPFCPFKLPLVISKSGFESYHIQGLSLLSPADSVGSIQICVEGSRRFSHSPLKFRLVSVWEDGIEFPDLLQV